MGGSKDVWLPCRDPVRSKHTINKGETKMGSINLKEKENNLTVFFYERWGILSYIFLLGNFLMTMLLLLKCWSDDEEQHEVNCGISVLNIILRISPWYKMCYTSKHGIVICNPYRHLQKHLFSKSHTHIYKRDVHIRCKLDHCQLQNDKGCKNHATAAITTLRAEYKMQLCYCRFYLL